MTKRPKYTEAKRKEVAKYAAKHGNAEARRKFGVSLNSITRWKRVVAPADRSDGRNSDGTFKPGQSGNPDGGTSAARRARMLAEKASVKVIETYVEEFEHAAKKDPGERNTEMLFEFGDRILNRGMGKPTQKTKVDLDADVRTKGTVNLTNLPLDVLDRLTGEDE